MARHRAARLPISGIDCIGKLVVALKMHVSGKLMGVREGVNRENTILFSCPEEKWEKWNIIYLFRWSKII